MVEEKAVSKDISDLIAWAENRYGIPCPKIIWTTSRQNSRSGESQGLYIEGGPILLWEGSEDIEFLFLHEYHHHLFWDADLPDPKENEAIIDALAKRDLYFYRLEKMRDFEKYLTETEGAGLETTIRPQSATAGHRPPKA